MATAVWRCLLAALLLSLLVRLAGFGHFVAARTFAEGQLAHYEGTMAHWAWQVREGRPLYPDGNEDPYAANAYGPLYFWLSGGTAKWRGIDQDRMLPHCRLAALAAFLASTLLLAEAARRRFGALPACVAAGIAVAPQLSDPFALMARSDTLAELLGFAGFLFACRRGTVAGVAGAALLAAAILARQTAGAFAVAAALACWLDGRGRRGAGIFGGSLALVGGALLVATYWEPRIVEGMLLQRHAEFDAGQLRAVAGRMLRWCPELCLLMLLAAAGIRRADGARCWAVLALTLGAATLFAAGKVGSDINYFLSWRLPAGWAAAALVARCRTGGSGARLALLAAVAALCVWSALLAAEGIAFRRALDADPDRHRQREEFRRLAELAADRATLTDDAMLAFHLNGRTPFVDPGLASALARRGAFDARALAGRIARGEFALAALRMDPFAPRYGEHSEALPPGVAAALRQAYRLAGTKGGLFLYVPN